MGIRFEVQLQKARIDKRAWLNQLAIEMEQSLEEALIAWLNAATAPIPVWSGASLGTFSHLAERVNFILRISPTPRGSQLGEGESAGKAQSTGTIDIDSKRGLFNAEYSTSLEHLIFNEFNNANLGGDPKVFSRLRSPGPYGFLAAGREAFERVVSQAELPSKVPLKITKREVR